MGWIRSCWPVTSTRRLRPKSRLSLSRPTPLGLLGMGAPPDEYDDAAKEFTRRVLKDEPMDSKAIEDWLVDRYGIARSLPGRDVPFREVAKGLEQIA